MKIQPMLHWNNFTVPELKEILEHCAALEALGIAQDEEMMCSIKRDITLRTGKPIGPGISFESLPTNTKRQTAQNQSNTNKIIKKTGKQPQEILLEQNA